MLPDNYLDEVRDRVNTADKKQLVSDVMTLLIHGYQSNKAIEYRDKKESLLVARLIELCFHFVPGEDMREILLLHGYVPIDKKDKVLI